MPAIIPSTLAAAQHASAASTDQQPREPSSDHPQHMPQLYYQRTTPAERKQHQHWLTQLETQPPPKQPSTQPTLARSCTTDGQRRMAVFSYYLRLVRTRVVRQNDRNHFTLPTSGGRAEHSTGTHLYRAKKAQKAKPASLTCLKCMVKMVPPCTQMPLNPP